MKFEREERVAFARIISDLIEADFIVEEDEMESLDQIIVRKEPSEEETSENKDRKEKKEMDKHFRISMPMLSEAKTMTFAEAVSTLQKVKSDEGKKIMMDRLYKTSLSDGTCVPLEALQIIAVKYALEGKGLVFSIPSGSSFIENMKVLYIENEDETETDAYIRSHYRAISNEFRLAGFDFVYIPQIVEDYKSIRGEYLRKVITYMMPRLKEDKIEKIQQDLCSMTTSRFSHELLYKKMGINMLSSKPAFLIKIGESSVADKSGTDDMERNMFSNFLLVPIDKIGETKETYISKNLLEHVVELLDSYRSMVSGNLNVEIRSNSKRFLYYGFHRSLFDLIAYGKNKTDYKLVINIYNSDNPIILRPVDAECDKSGCSDDLPINMSTQHYTLYILMVYMSLFEKGLDWDNYKNTESILVNGVMQIVKHRRKHEILWKYNIIYKIIGKGSKTTDKYRDKTHVSKLSKSLRLHKLTVTNIDLFLPEKLKINESEFYNVPLPPNLVYVIEKDKSGQIKEVRMLDSEIWKSELWKKQTP